MKKVYAAINPVDAHLVKGVLEGERISAEVRGEFVFGMRGEIPITPDTCPSVWILDDSDYDKAMALVATFSEPAQVGSCTGEVWRCACGEDNERQFTECWNCGTARNNGC